MKYSLSPQEIPWASPSGFPLGSGYISSNIPSLVTIQIQSSYIARLNENHRSGRLLVLFLLFGQAFFMNTNDLATSKVSSFVEKVLKILQLLPCR